MTATASAFTPDAVRRGDAAARLARATVATALLDGSFASVQAGVFHHVPVGRMWQGVAGTVVGRDAALAGGGATVALGLALHVGVAFGWSLAFLLLVRALPPLRAALRTRGGALAVASVFGPLVWCVMSLAVIPALVHRPPAFGPRWWVQLVGHAAFVGMPIVWGIARHAGVERHGTAAS